MNDVAFVYGRVKKSTIDLPREWKKTVHLETISVSLTPVGMKQDIFVKRIEEDKVILVSQGPIDCYYQIFAEKRKDLAEA